MDQDRLEPGAELSRATGPGTWRSGATRPRSSSGRGRTSPAGPLRWTIGPAARPAGDNRGTPPAHATAPPRHRRSPPRSIHSMSSGPSPRGQLVTSSATSPSGYRLSSKHRWAKSDQYAVRSRWKSSTIVWDYGNRRLRRGSGFRRSQSLASRILFSKKSPEARSVFRCRVPTLSNATLEPVSQTARYRTISLRWAFHAALREAISDVKFLS